MYRYMLSTVYLPCSGLGSTFILITCIGGFMVYNFIYNLADIFFGKVYIIKSVRPVVWNRNLINLIKVLINPAFQFFPA